jgi:hypothetical protein
VVADEHDIAGAEVWMNATCRIGENQRLAAKSPEQADGGCHGVHGMTLVGMNPALLEDHGNAVYESG